METTTNELVLSEIIKINTEITKINGRFDSLENDVKELKEGQEEIIQTQEEIIKTINFVGSKVFDNHEVRIARLETSFEKS